jgi:DNA-binding GntR family transcriptional regulator
MALRRKDIEKPLQSVGLAAVDVDDGVPSVAWLTLQIVDNLSTMAPEDSLPYARHVTNHAGDVVGGASPFAEEAASAEGDSSLQRWARSSGGMTFASGRTLITTSLREGIVSGAIAAGEQLKQDELSSYFGVSPGPIREALRQLESEGLVRHYPNRGAFVTDVSTEEVVAVLLPVRFLLEKYAFQIVQERMDERLAAKLQTEVDTMQHGADTQDVAMINEADVRFHEIVLESSGAYQTIQLWHSVLPRIRLQFYRLTPRHPHLDEVPIEHRDLLDALRSGDREHLAEVLQEHIIGTSSSLLNRAAPEAHNENGSGRPPTTGED